METVGHGWMWAAFAVIVMFMLAMDLLALGGARARKVSTGEAAAWSLVWVLVSLGYAAALWWYLDATLGRDLANEKALDFVTGYLIEKSLAIDNVFVWLMLFAYFGIPLELQKRVLVFGVIGAIAMRTLMIFAGVWLIERLDWILYVFGAFLLVTGIKMAWSAGEKPDLDRNPAIRWLRGHIRTTKRLQGERFFVVTDDAGRLVRRATPLFLVLVLVELSDAVFAVDSIPAIFAITTDPFIVLTSNVFAILGLRAMYFLVANLADRFSKLHYGLAAVLAFIGFKMLLADLVHIPGWISLGIIAAVIGVSLVWSLFSARRREGG